MNTFTDILRGRGEQGTLPLSYLDKSGEMAFLIASLNMSDSSDLMQERKEHRATKKMQKRTKIILIQAKQIIMIYSQLLVTNYEASAAKC